MKKKIRAPMVPRTAQETTRHGIMALLGEGPVSAKDISVALHLAEKEVCSHLEHIRRSLHASGGVLEIVPAECRSCGFVFAKRERLTPPGRCPVCRSEAINDPLFSLRGAQGNPPD
ncbi:transcriptional regulator [Thiovibrio frasassiensis]|uniref:Transcriptional regulator n=1 Tax=Thiovibrio frasassiensis TaxID=2984131 RepID=A0A9X4MFZ8_9BACT|nr:transcriptional regulator [Thiovibrio frasassiensis]MDG4476804.1 transcriptional regulator [Thiovibrio frasassiensis]